MTLVIGVLTHNYVVVACDRRLTFVEEPRKAKDDDTCKLVNLCDRAGIAYTGWAEIQGQPTHEWIATQLAARDCDNINSAAIFLQEAANVAFAPSPSALEQTFLLAGWHPAQVSDVYSIRPYFFIVSNRLDQLGRRGPIGKEFGLIHMRLGDARRLYICTVGCRLSRNRMAKLARAVRNVSARFLGPRAVFRLLVDEIRFTSRHCSDDVGEKVLCFCIPRSAAIASGALIKRRLTLAPSLAPTPNRPWFGYFDPNLGIHHYGPTYCCRTWAWTNVKAEIENGIRLKSISMDNLPVPR